MTRRKYDPVVGQWLSDLAASVLSAYVEIEPSEAGQTTHSLVDSALPTRSHRRLSTAEVRHTTVLLRKLPPRERVVLQLHDLEGFSYGEIAQGLRIPIGTVRSRAYRGRRQLGKFRSESAGDKPYGSEVREASSS